MIIITGPQSTSDELEALDDVASILNAVPAFSAALQWAVATALYCMAGWESCPLAVADVTIAEAFGLAVHYLSV
ncbi:hypothetical protein [Streptomyces sp. NBC_00076]|uniref:hypothetical protein n=1 Tax=Streptomyces sp. NBC_00076 TaxID=2975642 RepID=UPI0032554905